MKKAFLIFIVLCPFFTSFAQSDGESYESIEEVFRKNLKVKPSEFLPNKKDLVVLSLNIDSDGNPDSLYLIAGNTTVWIDEVVRVSNLAKDNWSENYLGERKKGQSYLVVCSLSLQEEDQKYDEDKVERFLSKEKYAKALPLLNDFIANNPYRSDYYEKRSAVFRGLGEVENAQRDFMTAKQIKNKVLVNTSVRIFGITKVPGN